MSTQSLHDEVQAILGEEHPYEGISGGAEWMHTLGFGPLDEEDDDGAAAETTVGVRHAPQPQATTGADASTPATTQAAAWTYESAVATWRHRCGQLALVVGRCVCEMEADE